ncbi:MAG: hypothetical protein JST79_16910 [Acidobacteria bacterium]|nr:hypothetical protein [Acidobacteriota bacterium]
MSPFITVLLLLTAAVLEVGGDALIRRGLHSSAGTGRGIFLALGAVVLFIYGWTVNTPPWDFGRLLGLYVVFFFVVSQAVSWLAFRQPPSPAMMIGGAFIVTGGVIITLYR